MARTKTKKAARPVNPRIDQVAKRVSEALKRVDRWKRYDAALKFARKMEDNAQRVRVEGCRLPGGKEPRFTRAFLNALCWGMGDSRNRTMIKRYESAAKAARRFCRR